MIANRLREDTSSRCKVRRSRPIVSRTNQWSRCAAMAASQASTGLMSPRGLQHQGADLRLVGAQQQHRVVQLARHRQRPPTGAGGDECRARSPGRSFAPGRSQSPSRRARHARSGPRPSDTDSRSRVDRRVRAAAVPRLSASAGRSLRCGERCGALGDQLRKARGRRDPIDQLPRLGAIGAHALRRSCRTHRRGRAAPCVCRRAG